MNDDPRIISKPDGTACIIVLDGEGYWKWDDGRVSHVNKTETRRIMLDWGYPIEELVATTDRLFDVPAARPQEWPAYLPVGGDPTGKKCFCKAPAAAEAEPTEGGE